MTESELIELARSAMLVMVKVAAPPLLAGLAIGLLISIFQAVTQIQEQTLTFIPKLTAMIIAAIILMPWIGHRLIEYTAISFKQGLLPW